MNPIEVKVFNKGLITRIEDIDAARGSASDSLNWHTLGDHIELRRGQKVLGNSVDGAGRITGLAVGRRADDYQIPIYSYLRKFLYYDSASDAQTEIGSDILPAAASGEDISFSPYNSIAGNSVYGSSPNSSIYKLLMADPSSPIDLLSTTYRGKIRIKQSRMILWDRKDAFGGSDATAPYLSHIDGTDNIYQYTSAEELNTGDGVTTAFTGTLAFKASNSKESAFYPVIAGAKVPGTGISAISKVTAAVVTSNGHGLVIGDTVIFAGVVGMVEINDLIGVVTAVADVNNFTVNIDSTDFTSYSSGGTVLKAERFTDDKVGNLSSLEGGTGTINYATGAYSITFFNAPINLSKIVAQYFREDPTRTDAGYGGIADFLFSSPRTAGEGVVFRQDDAGGKFMNMESFGADEYCLHEFKTWLLTLTSDDTNATNVIYRDNVGIPYFRASKATGDGIYYVDAIGENPAIRILDYGKFLSQVLPRSISTQLDLRAYTFDEAVMFEWGDYICMACKQNTETINNRLFMYHKTWKTWEIHSFRVSCLDILNGALIAGDSGSNNLFKLFSGRTDEDSNIPNYYITDNDGLDKEGVKKVNVMRIRGLIEIDQVLRVSYSPDNQPFVAVVDIAGNGSYVNLSERKLIGTLTLGETQIGGGQDEDDAIYASPYELQFHIGTDKLEKIRLKFEAINVGYVSVSEYDFDDLRSKGKRSPQKYVAPF